MIFNKVSRPVSIGIWVVSLVTAGAIGFAVATAATAEDDAKMSCPKTCDAAMDACTQKCADHVDNERCPEECLDKHDHCVKKCVE